MSVPNYENMRVLSNYQFSCDDKIRSAVKYVLNAIDKKLK